MCAFDVELLFSKHDHNTEDFQRFFFSFLTVSTVSASQTETSPGVPPTKNTKSTYSVRALFQKVGLVRSQLP